MSKTKDEQRKEIEDQINKFLSEGGEIEKVEMSVSKSGYPLNRKQRKAQSYFKNSNHKLFKEQNKK
tara:strand:+ start:386 stop:583 length:198 start_codon:yes stop_codon:yes gene_type:complete